MSNKITILGSGTCQIEKDRMASAVLADLEGLRIVYDFGRGVSQRLAEIGLTQDDINHIIISHLHPDHLSDLIPFLHAACWSKTDPRNTSLNIYGAAGVKTQLTKLINAFESGDLTSRRFEINIHEITENEFSINNQKFQFIELPPLNNHGLKFEFKGKTYAFTGDSDFHRQLVEFLKDTDFSIINTRHIKDDDIIELAVSTKAKLIIFSHLYWELNEKNLNILAQKRGYQGRLVAAKDLAAFDI